MSEEHVARREIFSARAPERFDSKPVFFGIDPKSFDAREICFVMAQKSLGAEANFLVMAHQSIDIKAIRFVIAQKYFGVEAIFLVISPGSFAIAPERVASEENFFVADFSSGAGGGMTRAAVPADGAARPPAPESVDFRHLTTGRADPKIVVNRHGVGMPGNRSMMQILSHTPLWVFGLFFGLVYLGVLQSRTRRISRQRLIVLPVAMLGWSLYSVWSTFDTHLTALAAWACVWGIVVAVGLARAPLQGASYDADTKQFTVPGSWVPLALMMGIFFVKYAVAVVHAVKPGVFDATTAVAVVAGTYGLFSGMFAARALRGWA